MIVDRCLLAGTPDEADDGQAIERVGVEQVLLVVLGMRLGKLLGEPVVGGDQFGEQRLAVGEDGLLAGTGFQ